MTTNNSGDSFADKAQEVAKDVADLGEAMANVIKDTWGPGAQANQSLDPTLASLTLDDYFKSANLTANALIPGINASTFNVAQQQQGLSPAEAVVLGLAATAIADSIPEPEKQQGAIDAGDTAAGRVNNLAVVSEADVGALMAAYGSISGLTPEGQFAQARVGAAIDAARAKLAAAKAAQDMGGKDNPDYAQQFGSKEAYLAYRQKVDAEQKKQA